MRTSSNSPTTALSSSPTKVRAGTGLRLWLLLLIEHVLEPLGYKLNGDVSWTADEDDDRGTIYVKDNLVETIEDVISNEGPSWRPSTTWTSGSRRDCGNSLILPTTRAARPTLPSYRLRPSRRSVRHSGRSDAHPNPTITLPSRTQRPADRLGFFVRSESTGMERKGGPMPGLRFAHHNSCPRCPVIGAEDISGEKFFEFRALRFSLQAVRELVKPSMLHRIDNVGLAAWLEHVFINPRHVDHLPSELGPGLMVTFPAGQGRPLIDGDHRAARALRDGTEFLVYLLPEAETLKLLRRSMSRTIADAYWQCMSDSQPHPNDVSQGEQR
jgi:hypothetical protein